MNYGYSGMYAHMLRPGDDFGSLRENYVIFLTEHDILGKEKPLYRIERRIEETGELFDDGEHIIYVNGASRDTSTALGKLMHDFFCTDPDDMEYQQLARKSRYFKEDEKGVATMCKALEDMRKETAWQTKVESVKRWIAKGLSFEDIADGEGLTIAQVEEIAKEETA